MRALIFHAPRRIVVEERADPAPAPGEVVLRTDAAGICASDLRVYRGEKHAAAGVIPGHEITGTVGAVGEGVDDVAPGERVAVYPIVACGRCDFCRRGLRNRCGSRRTLGYDLDGGIAEYVRLPAPIVGQGQLMPVPDGVPAERAAMTEPTACVLNSLESCRFRAGAAVAIIGAGPMGLTHIILARALGAGAIVVAEPVASRRAVAEELGATVVCGGDAAEIRQTVSDATRGAGAEVVIVSVGLDGLTELALPIAAKQGRDQPLRRLPARDHRGPRREFPALQRDRPDRQPERDGRPVPPYRRTAPVAGRPRPPDHPSLRHGGRRRRLHHARRPRRPENHRLPGRRAAVTSGR